MKDHDCENNIESNMTDPHCRICGKELFKGQNWRKVYMQGVEETKTRVVEKLYEIQENTLISDDEMGEIITRIKNEI